MLHPSNFEYCLLRRILVRWAARFTSDETLQAKLVEKTIRKTLQDFLLKDDGAAIDLELLAVKTANGRSLKIKDVPRESRAQPEPKSGPARKSKNSKSRRKGR